MARKRNRSTRPPVNAGARGERPEVLVTEIPPVTTHDLLALGSVKAALNDLEQGRFMTAADLVDAMWRDDRIPGVVETRIDALHGLEMSFDPPEGNEEDARAEALAEAAERAWTSWLPEEAASELRRWGLMLNMGIGRIRWDTSGETWEPRVEVFHPRNVRWSETDAGYTVTTQQGEWLIRRDKAGLVARAPGGVEERNGWIVFTPWGWKRGWMRSLVRSLSILWLFRQWALRDWSAHSEAHGSPSKKAFVPNGTTPETKRRFLRDIAALVRRSAILLEHGTKTPTEEKAGFDVELLEAAADSHEVFDRLKAAVDTDIAVRVKGSNLTTEVKGGSLAAAKAHRDVDQEKLRFDAGTLGTCVHDQLCAPWADLNFGARELAPWPRWSTEPPEDLKTTAEAFKLLGEATTGLWDAGYPVDLERMSERFNLPVQEGAAFPKTRPAPAATPAPRGALAALTAAAGLPRGALAGQLYADRVVDRHGARGAEVLRPDIDALLAAVRASTSWDDLRTRLLTTYEGMEPEALQEVIRGALILSELNGQLSAREDEE